MGAHPPSTGRGSVSLDGRICLESWPLPSPPTVPAWHVSQSSGDTTTRSGTASTSSEGMSSVRVSSALVVVSGD